jgi:SAM-dependent methyltransferase
VAYQKRYAKLDFGRGARVLDVGSGAHPFSHATVRVDRYGKATVHRAGGLVLDGKPFVLGDVQRLPFADGSFDFAYCSHVLEHVDDPLEACNELMRVAKAGYLETPSFAKDVLFCWARGMHKWFTVAAGGNLAFFEYSARQLEGIGASYWKDAIFSRLYHPLQRAFYENQDLFNTMLSWKGSFRVFVFRLDGTVVTGGGSGLCGGPGSAVDLSGGAKEPMKQAQAG